MNQPCSDLYGSSHHVKKGSSMIVIPITIFHYRFLESLSPAPVLHERFLICFVEEWINSTTNMDSCKPLMTIIATLTDAQAWLLLGADRCTLFLVVRECGTRIWCACLWKTKVLNLTYLRVVIRLQTLWAGYEYTVQPVNTCDKHALKSKYCIIVEWIRLTLCLSFQ